MDKQPLTEDQQLELVKNQVNKMVTDGDYTPPPGWAPYDVDPEVRKRIEEARNR